MIYLFTVVLSNQIAIQVPNQKSNVRKEIRHACRGEFIMTKHT